MIDLDELMRLHEAATPGPWEVKIGDFESEDGYGTVTAPYVEADGKTICVPFDRGPDDENDEEDAAYIVAACNAAPEMVQKIRVLLKEHRETLEEYNQFLRKHIELRKRFNKLKEIAIIEGQIIQELLAKGEEQGRPEEDDA